MCTSVVLVQEMTAEERKIIKHLDKCDFTEIHRYFVDKTAARKALSREEKQVRLRGPRAAAPGPVRLLGP